MTVLDKDFNIIADEQILEQRFHDIIEHSNTVDFPEKLAIGALTTGDRTTWSAARNRLCQFDERNAQSLSAIDQAIAVIALDDHLTGMVMHQIFFFI